MYELKLLKHVSEMILAINIVKTYSLHNSWLAKENLQEIKYLFLGKTPKPTQAGVSLKALAFLLLYLPK